MQFVKKFEPIIRTTDNLTASLGLFDSYEQANDAVIIYASQELPKETVAFYQIIEVNQNLNATVNITTP